MERIPTWVIDDRSGSAEGEPESWEHSSSEAGPLWKRAGLMSFGRANALYRHRHYVCPECEAMLRPLRRRGYFACIGCLLAFRWSDGALTGHGVESEHAVHVDPAEFRFR